MEQPKQIPETKPATTLIVLLKITVAFVFGILGLIGLFMTFCGSIFLFADFRNPIALMSLGVGIGLLILTFFVIRAMVR